MHLPLPQRLQSLSYYLGTAIFIRFDKAVGRGEFARLHAAAAMGSFLLLLCVGLGLVLGVAWLSVTMVFMRPVYDALHPEPYVLDAVWKAFLAWCVVHAFGALHALMGWQRPVPLVTRLGQRRWVRVAVRAAAGVLLVPAILTTALAAHAGTLTSNTSGDGQVYFVYEDNGTVPRWVFDLGIYRVALEARRQYGPGQVVLLRISEAHLKEAFAHGTFVIVGSHGQAQGIIAEGKWFTPNDLAATDVGEELRMVYLAGCDSGAQAEEWQRALAPARVITHDRLTAVVEHVWYLWMEAPEQLRRVAEKNPRGRVERKEG